MKTNTSILKRDGEVISTTETPIVTDDKVQSIVVKIDKDMVPAYKKAVTFWNGQLSQRKKTFDSLVNMGNVLTHAKQSVNGNNKIFGKWLADKFPEMTSRYGSYSMKIARDADKIEAIESLDVSNRMFANPESVYNAYMKATKEEVETEETETEETEETEETDTGVSPDSADQVVNLETLTPEDRIETVHASVNLMIEGINRGSYNEDQINHIKNIFASGLKAVALFEKGE